jgi:predicted DCC family thiol-disulfide oxidoreductase YuxK
LRDPAGRVPALPNQTPGLKERLGLTRADVDREVWAVAADGALYAGAEAVNAVLRELGGGWRVVARVAALPGPYRIERQMYAWVARNRGRFARWGAAPACGRPGTMCDPEGSVD